MISTSNQNCAEGTSQLGIANHNSKLGIANHNSKLGIANHNSKLGAGAAPLFVLFYLKFFFIFKENS